MSKLAHARGILVAIHVVAITAGSLPVLVDQRVLTPEAWEDPIAQAEFANWADRLTGWGFESSREDVAQTAWDAATGILHVQQSLNRPFHPYYHLAGTRQRWRMFPAAVEEPVRLRIDIWIENREANQQIPSPPVSRRWKVDQPQPPPSIRTPRPGLPGSSAAPTLSRRQRVPAPMHQAPWRPEKPAGVPESSLSASWETVHLMGSPEHRWLAHHFERDRFRAALNLYAWGLYPETYEQFVDWLAAEAKRDFPNATRLRVGFEIVPAMKPGASTAPAPLSFAEAKQLRTRDFTP